MNDIDIWRAAYQMIQLYGEDASVKSALRADAMLDLGDVPGFHAWKRIVAAINDLRQECGDEPLN